VVSANVTRIAHRSVVAAGTDGTTTWHTAGVLSPPLSDAVRDALAESQRLGMLGNRPIDDVVEHARAFVDALASSTGRVVDLGAGGGVPGFVLAHDRPDLHLTLVDRRSKRTDFLQRIVSRLGWSGRVDVITGDVEVMVQSVADRAAPAFDVAVARGFGPPDVTLEFAARLVRPGGLIVISEPPTGDRWDPDLLAELGISRIDCDDPRVVCFQRHGFT
jgi:16S rRNA (guanine527-N7)-methyltransferase